jgi:hypothetical protein
MLFQVDGHKLHVPRLQGLVVLNIPRYHFLIHIYKHYGDYIYMLTTCMPASLYEETHGAPGPTALNRPLSDSRSHESTTGIEPTIFEVHFMKGSFPDDCVT